MVETRLYLLPASPPRITQQYHVPVNSINIYIANYIFPVYI